MTMFISLCSNQNETLVEISHNHIIHLIRIQYFTLTPSMQFTHTEIKTESETQCDTV